MSTLTVDYSVFADKALSEADTGKLSLIGIFQAVTRDYPVIPTCAFCCFLKGEPGPINIQLRILPDSSEEIITEATVSALLDESGKGAITFNMIGLPIVGKKEIVFRVMVGENEIHSNSIQIRG